MKKTSPSSFINQVFIDGKEQERMIKKATAFFNMKNIPVSKKTLGDYGDVAILLASHQILNVERKTISDFCSSYMSGHLQDQAVRMNKVFRIIIVVLYMELCKI